MTHERIQDILAVEMQNARASVDWKRFGSIKDLAKRAARLNARGLFVVGGEELEATIRVERFTGEERKALIDDGAVIYLPTGETIRGQQQAENPFWFVNGGYVDEDGKNRLLDFPSRRIEVAIYVDPKDPERFFVLGSFNKNTDQQDKLRAKDAEDLRKRLGLPGITMIRPEAPEVTEVMFKHFTETGVRLLGEDWVKDGYWRYIRTSTPTNKSGSGLARVGRWDAGGVGVLGWHRDEGVVHLGDARWVVPNKSR